MKRLIYRVDDRFIHGQVLEGWVNYLHIKDIIIVNDDGTFSTNNTLVLDTFLVATVGALRGVMMKNLRGTPLEPYYLPLIPMENFRTKNKH